MKRRNFQFGLLVLASLLLAPLGGCVDPYLPEVILAAKDQLVVNGFINSQGITTIQLSRSLKLVATTAPPAEGRATVWIQSETGMRYLLVESPAGTYTSANLTLDPSQKYQLRLTTASRRDYATPLQVVKTAPPVDDLSWRFENDGVQLYINAHDDARNSVYYRWKYEETWQFTSAYESKLEYFNNRMRRRVDDIYHCWQTVKSTVIKQANTTRLSQDAVVDFPLLFLPSRSQKLPYKYSILVQQSTQTQEEYDYWEALKKNTESIGSINDPLPTQLTGNLKSLTDPSEDVLGFVGVHSVTERRIFIGRRELPIPYTQKFETGYEVCKEVVEIFPLRERPPPGVSTVFDTPYFLPTDYVGTPSSFIGYIGGSAECVDCRVRGTTVKPSFWP